MNPYQKYLSIDEFLFTSFALLKKKLNLIYSLSKEEQTIEIIKKRYEETGKILEALNLLASSIDNSKENAKELHALYEEMAEIVFKGNNENPELLLKLLNSF